MSYTHLGDTRPKARKQYRCYLCHRPIDVGERHVYRKSTDDGEFVAARMHERCESLTHDWDIDEWESHDPAEFRRWILREEPTP